MVKSIIPVVTNQGSGRGRDGRLRRVFYQLNKTKTHSPPLDPQSSSRLGSSTDPPSREGCIWVPGLPLGRSWILPGTGQETEEGLSSRRHLQHLHYLHCFLIVHSVHLSANTFGRGMPSPLPGDALVPAVGVICQGFYTFYTIYTVF